MTITEITISKGLTINLGNYESKRVDVTLRATVDEGEDVDEAFARLNQKCNDKLIVAKGK